MVVIQNDSNNTSINKKKLINILQEVISDLNHRDSELFILLVNKNQIQKLNHTYRHKNSPTNVLSFVSDLPAEIEQAILGDVVICPEIVQAEAAEQNKTFFHHLVHMAIHGTLHLLGYDHIKDDEAQEMEATEIKILNTLGIQNPY